MSSTGKKKKASEASPDAIPAKRGKDASELSGCAIKSLALFTSAFGPEYAIESSPTLKMNAWNDEASRKKISAWLVSHGSHFASLLNKIKRTTEPALYPLLVNAIGPILEVSSFKIEAPKVDTEGMSEDQKEALAEMIVQNSRRKSLTSLVESNESSDMLNTIDTANIDEVRHFLIYMEEAIKSMHFENKGRVELMIHDDERPHMVFEAKPQVINNDDEGVFQTAAYMVIANLEFGVYTSHKAWKFLRMVPVPAESSTSSAAPSAKYVIRHTKYFDLMKTSYEELDQQAVDVYAHLLEMLGVSNSTDLMASSAAANASLAGAGQQLTTLL